MYPEYIWDLLNSKVICRHFLKKSLKEIRSLGRRSRHEHSTCTYEYLRMRETAEQRTQNLNVEECRISLNDGLFSCSSRISSWFTLKLLSYVRRCLLRLRVEEYRWSFESFLLVSSPGLIRGSHETELHKKPYDGEELLGAQSGSECWSSNTIWCETRSPAGRTSWVYTPIVWQSD